MNNNNMTIYEMGRSVPKAAQKQFDNGKFKGTDINPMWRIQKLTEIFGPAGIGWYYDVVSERSEQHGDDVMAIVDIKLYIKVNNEWSKPIYGTGGNILLHNGKMSDEGYKMALTDALSVACKALGVGADIYWPNGKTKYSEDFRSDADADSGGDEEPIIAAPVSDVCTCAKCGAAITSKVALYSSNRFGRALCYNCQQQFKS